MGRQVTGLGTSRWLVCAPDIPPARAWLERWRLQPTPLDALWRIPAQAIGHAQDATVGWRLRPVINASAPITLVTVEPVLPAAMRHAALRPGQLRITEDADLIHFDPPPEDNRSLPTLVLRVGPASASWMYTRTDLFERLRIAGGRYEMRTLTPSE